MQKHTETAGKSKPTHGQAVKHLVVIDGEEGKVKLNKTRLQSSKLIIFYTYQIKRLKITNSEFTLISLDSTIAFPDLFSTVHQNILLEQLKNWLHL